jgi:hypothetical protein
VSWLIGCFSVPLLVLFVFCWFVGRLIGCFCVPLLALFCLFVCLFWCVGWLIGCFSVPLLVLFVCMFVFWAVGVFVVDSFVV